MSILTYLESANAFATGAASVFKTLAYILTSALPAPTVIPPPANVIVMDCAPDNVIAAASKSIKSPAATVCALPFTKPPLDTITRLASLIVSVNCEPDVS